MITSTIANNKQEFDNYVAVGPVGVKWSTTEWNAKLFWCMGHLETNEWIPLPQKGVIMMKPEAYFMYKLEHGVETET
jgi:hypothetical protein